MDLIDVDLTADIIDITCGVLQAKLHRQRFICPGINRECIEYEGRFITPKTFYVLADKGSLKDWKNAIRISGKKIRRYIDTGALDFFNHTELCTGRCKSKMGNKSLQQFSVADSGHISVQSSKLPKVMFENHEQYSSNESLNIVKDLDSYNDIPDVKPDVEHLRLLNVLNLQQQQQNVPNMAGDQVTPMQLVSLNKNMHDDEDEDAMFWRAIVQLGLIDEFFREVKSKLDVLKASMIKNFVPVGDAKKASRIVNELGMRSKLDMRLCAHKFEFDRQRDKLEKEMEQLKRKVTEYEQRKEILKQKSDTYEILMTKKIKLDDMSSSDMQTEPSSSGIIVTLNGDCSPNTASPKSDDISSTDLQRKAKRARIEGISQELSHFAEHAATPPMSIGVLSPGEEESRSDSPLVSQESTTITASQDSTASESVTSSASSL
ncbi:Glucocorticoid modulatory element binding protein 2 [Mactra antiquata]